MRRGGAGGLRGQGETAVDADVMRELERMVLLYITDTKWREHLYEMDYLQEGIHLRSYAQKDPLDGVPARGVRDVRGARSERSARSSSGTSTGWSSVRQEAQQSRPQRVPDNRAEVESGGDEAAAPQGGEPEPGDQRQGAAQRSVPVRLGQEVQEVPRRGRLTTAPASGYDGGRPYGPASVVRRGGYLTGIGGRPGR